MNQNVQSDGVAVGQAGGGFFVRTRSMGPALSAEGRTTRDVLDVLIADTIPKGESAL